ncbi:tumor necrosis factor receptor superfamily member 5-like [Ptychodera flava]|uniref:tumor necrosis factor receptor superfamily member 5-like n=1 Tax=Ptychodera flava TaxID=63121 RepID=UPI00396A7E0B
MQFMESLTLITVTFIVLVIFPLGRSNPICTQRQFLHEGRCCNLCPPGQTVRNFCLNKEDDRVCVPCPEGYYMDHWNSRRWCFPIDLCDKAHEYTRVKASLDGTSNSVCDCVDGYEYSMSGEICIESISPTRDHLPLKTTSHGMTSPSHSVTKNDMEGSIVTTMPSGNETRRQDGDRKKETTKLHWTIGFSSAAAVLVIVVVAVAVICRKRIRQQCRPGKNHQNDPDRISVQMEDLTVKQTDSRPQELHRNAITSNGFYPISTVENEESDNYDDGHGTSVTTSGPTSENSILISESSGILEDLSLPQVDTPFCMKEDDKTILRKLMPEFADDLPVRQVLDRMSDVFSEEDEAKITNISQHIHDQRRQLVGILMTKGAGAFDRFVIVLEEVCRHLADRIKEKKNKQTSSTNSIHNDFNV